MKKLFWLILIILFIAPALSYAAADGETGDMNASPISLYGKTSEGVVTAIQVEEDGKLVTDVSSINSTDDVPEGDTNLYWKEAPEDSKTYGRRNAEWTEISDGGAATDSLWISDATDVSLNATESGKDVDLIGSTVTADFFIGDGSNLTNLNIEIEGIASTDDLTEGVVNLYFPGFTDLKIDYGISISDYQEVSEKGQANGYASLDASSKLPVEQLPITTVEYQGVWDADSNDPELSDATGTQGDLYIVGTAGTQDLGSGSITFSEGDWVLYNGSIWQATNTGTDVNSVNGLTGVVVIDLDDINDVDLSSTGTNNFLKYDGSEWENATVFVTGTCTTSRTTAAKTVTIPNYAPTAGDLIAITFTDGFYVSNATLNINGTGAKNIKIAGINVSTTTLNVAAATSFELLLYYNGTSYQMFGSYRTSDSNSFDRHNLTSVIVGDDGCSSYKLGAISATDNKFYPFTLEDSNTNYSKTVQTEKFRFGSPILMYNSSTDLVADTVTSGLYQAVPSSQMRYTFNQNGGYTLNSPIYLVVDVDEDGLWSLDDTSATSWYTQTLPSSEDGKVYIYIGYVYTAQNYMRLTFPNIAYEYKDDKLCFYTDAVSASADTLATVTERGATTTTEVTFEDVNINGDLSIGNELTVGTIFVGDIYADESAFVKVHEQIAVVTNDAENEPMFVLSNFNLTASSFISFDTEEEDNLSNTFAVIDYSEDKLIDDVDYDFNGRVNGDEGSSFGSGKSKVIFDTISVDGTALGDLGELPIIDFFSDDFAITTGEGINYGAIKNSIILFGVDADPEIKMFTQYLSESVTMEIDSDYFKIKSTGLDYFKVENDTEVIGDLTVGADLTASLSVGLGAAATGANSVAIGRNAIASGKNSFSFGSAFPEGEIENDTEASGDYSVAMGVGNRATGLAGVAMGIGCVAEGIGANAFGFGNTASGELSTVMGSQHLTVSGNNSFGIALSDVDDANVSEPNVMAIMGGNVGIGTVAPESILDIQLSDDASVNFSTFAANLGDLDGYLPGDLILTSPLIIGGVSSTFPDVVSPSYGLATYDKLLIVQYAEDEIPSLSFTNSAFSNEASIDYDIESNIFFTSTNFASLNSETDTGYDLGTTKYPWDDLYLSGDASINGALTVSEITSTGSGALTLQSNTDTVVINDDLSTNGSVTAITYYGDGSNLTGVSTSSNWVDIGDDASISGSATVSDILYANEVRGTESVTTLNGDCILDTNLTSDGGTWYYEGDELGTGGGGTIDGSGTANYLAKWNDSDTLTDSIITDNGTIISVLGDLSSNGNLTATNGVWTDLLHTEAIDGTESFVTIDDDIQINGTLSISENMTATGAGTGSTTYIEFIINGETYTVEATKVVS